MDQTSERYLESKEELQRRMDDTRHSMANTMVEIKQELSAAVDWETYIQRYPGTCLLAGGAIGWAIGRKLGALSDEPTPSFVIREAMPIQPSEPSTVTRMAEMVVSSVFAQALPLFATKMRQFLGGPPDPVRE
jgi:hypothetical protein